MNGKTKNIFYPTKSICQYLWTKPSQVSRQKLQLKLWLIISSVQKNQLSSLVVVIFHL